MEARLSITRGSNFDPIEPGKLLGEGQATRLWSYIVPRPRTYDSLLEPVSWARSAAKLSLHDLVRCRASDGSFDVMLTVAMKTGSGVRMEFFAGRRPGEH